MEEYYVYYLYSKKLNKYYIGKTCELTRRLKEHNNQEEQFTKTGVPWLLISYIKCENSIVAYHLENKLKKSKNKNYIQWYFKKYGIDTFAGR